MPKLKPGTIWPTPEEEEEIKRGIAADPDAYELDDEWFKRARPAAEVHPELVEQWRKAQEKGQKIPMKAIVSIRLDPDLVKHFQDTGPDWESCINEILRRAAFGSQES